jgi:DNA-binding NtrC family response regulator
LRCAPALPKTCSGVGFTSHTSVVSRVKETAITAVAPAQLPSLTLVALSDSFSSIWPSLSVEAGFELRESNGSEILPDPVGTVTLIAAAGAEHEAGAVLRRFQAAERDVAVIGALPDHRLGVALARAGAADYFVLPQDLEMLRSWLLERAERFRARIQRSAFAADEGAKYRFTGIIGESPALRQSLERASRIIPHRNVTVLITGETGTGKELLARAIHYNGPRGEAPFVDVNCAAIPEYLLESELFGHEKGAFTGATTAKPGLFEVAEGGTVFLDEIGHLSLSLQGKLLRVLQERTTRRVGGTRSKPADVRILAATHVDLAAAVRQGEFREDLYHRLNVVPVELPPLRQRHDDVLLLAHRFLVQFASEYGIPEPSLSAEAEQALLRYRWPGNVRELRNLMERALLLGSGGVIDTGVLALDAGPGARSGPSSLDATPPLREIIRSAVRDAVERCGGNKSEAARRLEISRTRLQRLLENPDFTRDFGDEP